MDKLIVEKSGPLSGTVTISGSKNAALPILMACILPTGRIELQNVPRLADIRTSCKLLNILGCNTSFEGNTVVIECGQLNPHAPYELVKTMRASVLCLGPLLAVLGEARVSMPGGCAIGARPVDIHLTGLEQLGATFELEEGYIIGRTDGLKGAHIVMRFPSVGATEHLIMAAAMAEGETVIENAAREPEVADLANFLNACGARIEGQGTSVIRIEGVNGLRGTTYRVMSDRIEAGTFMMAAPLTGGELLLEHCPLPELDAVAVKLREMGVCIEEVAGGVRVACGDDLVGVDVETMPYPGFPTDMQAQITTLMCSAKGLSMVEENIFENRFMHVMELNRMGADIKVKGHTAIIKGMRKLVGAPVMASDLRASASLVLAGLVAEGKTEVQRIYHLDRGYEKMEDKLTAVGARITRVRA
ncbi:UDP-N-acetylglucosamine 1-carboxyvinyltransferase [Desulfovibrio sp. X2]|uniref:UDP-N-acetylglucosamine 1-carboxyvinyltransferase n=1 Tax=Desulfovibrio sp. X2 TaxID=941449 RepID=UPI000358CD22|nr:UDP-N-acetylglucosamine 1-carboxyvinyltransferase [Desulfovibrio sp. X2]EPR37020.1 UDP-N-acetylglucosamine 1-carboxyvinyltransferase [Desulfovibrio sp. X2]